MFWKPHVSKSVRIKSWARRPKPLSTSVAFCRAEWGRPRSGWRKLGQNSQYELGDMSGYKSTRAAMGDMAKSLERDPRLESILANRKKELRIDIDSGCRLGL